MKMTRVILVTSLLVSLGAGFSACAAQSKGEGSESHFFCRADADCRDAGADSICIDRICRPESALAVLPVPPACSADTKETGPFEVTFSFENPTGAPVTVVLGGHCGARYSISSCIDGYQHPLGLGSPCGVVCPEVPRGCSDGACVDEPLSITADTPQKQPWDGFMYVGEQTTAGVCAKRAVSRAGRYRLSVPIYSSVARTSPPSQFSEPPLDVLEVDFTLPMPGGVVHVPLVRADGGTDTDTSPKPTIDSGPLPAEGGACVPITARRYDPTKDCYGPKETLPDVCLIETAPGTTSGVSEMSCLVAPDGTRYAFAKGYTECIDDAASGRGWVAKGDVGLCQVPIADGPGKTDEACAVTVARGYWLGGIFGPRGVDFAGDMDAGPRDGRVEECK